MLTIVLMQTLFKLTARLPLAILRGVGMALGLLVWSLSRRYRREFNVHWAQAIRYWQTHPGPTHKPSKVRAIAQAGLFFSELPKIWCDPKSAQSMRISGFEAMEAALEKGHGLIILTPHLGAFELAPRAFGLKTPITVLYRPARKPNIEKLLQVFRPAQGVNAVPANASGVRELIRALRKGQTIGLLPDQVPSRGEGLSVDFLGRPAYTMTLPIRLAQATGATLAWATAIRQPAGWDLRLEIWEPEHPLASSDLSDLLAEMNVGLADRIAQAPEQYLWAYNRYKKGGV